MEDEKQKGYKSYIYYLIIMVSVLIISGITVSYAYFNVVNQNSKQTNTTITGKTDCVNISLTDNGAISLSYNYPIIDSYALANVKPVKVTIENSCPAGQAAIDYSLLLTSLADKESSTTYIGDSNIKTKISKTVGSAQATDVKTTGLLSSLPALATTKTTYTLLIQKLNENSKTNATAYPYKKAYVVEQGTIASNTTIVYDVYLWIDIAAANTTQNKKFASALSVVVNNKETLTA